MGDTSIYPATSRIIDFVAGFTIDQASEPLRARARLLFLDLLGVAIAAAGDEIAGPLHAVVADAAPGELTLIGSGGVADAGAAAFYNGSLAHALEFDDSTLNPVGHPSCVIVPALLALAQRRGGCGRALLEAYLVGLEVHSRLGQAHVARWSAEDSWLPIGHISVVGAAAGCARLLGLDRAATAHALGFAAHFSGALSISNGSLAKPLGAGAAARAGVEAALLAAAGATAAAVAIERSGGFADTFFGAGRHDLQAALARLGAPHHLEEIGIAIKRYPSCYATHWGVDALLSLIEEHGIAPQDIATITLAHPQAGAFCDNAAPATVEEARFSHEYNLSVAALDGIPGVASFTPERMARADVVAMLARVATHIHPADTPPEVAREYRVSLTTMHGASWSHAVPRPLGHPRRPMSAVDVEDKFRRATTGILSSDAATGLMTLVDRIDVVDDLGGLNALLASAVSRGVES